MDEVKNKGTIWSKFNEILRKKQEIINENATQCKLVSDESDDIEEAEKEQKNIYHQFRVTPFDLPFFSFCLSSVTEIVLLFRFPTVCVLHAPKTEDRKEC